MTYTQGASAELVAMATIAGADMFGLIHDPGAFVWRGGNHGRQRIRTADGYCPQSLDGLGLTLPMAVLLSGSLYWLLSHI